MSLEELPQGIEPPPALERRTVGALRSAGLVREVWWRRPAAVAALVAAAFLSGWLARDAARAAAPARQAQGSESPRFALLLYGGDAGGAEDDRVREYREWARRLASEGRRISGEKLADDAAVAGAGVPDAAALRGFFILDARSESEAQRIAATHPHVRHGGTVVVRRIVPT